MTEKHKLNSFHRAVNLPLTDPVELLDLLAWKAYQSQDKKTGVLMTSTPAPSVVNASETRLKWNANDRGLVWKPTDGSGIPVDGKAKSNTPGRGLAVFT